VSWAYEVEGRNGPGFFRDVVLMVRSVFPVALLSSVQVVNNATVFWSLLASGLCQGIGTPIKPAELSHEMFT